MKHKILIPIFSFVLLLSFGSVGKVWACSCKEYKSQQVYNLADIVFIGKVIEGFTEIKGEKDHYFSSSEIPTFEVTEAFVGVQKGERVKVDGGNLSSYCSFSIPLFADNEYVIYARKNKENIYETNYCLRSKMTDASTNEHREYQSFFGKELKEDLDFLREILPLKRNAILRGRVVQNVYEASVANVKIIIKNKNIPQKAIFTKSDSDGNFTLDLPEGEYKVEVETPKGKKLTKWTKEMLESIKLRRGGEMKLFIDLEKIK